MRRPPSTNYLVRPGQDSPVNLKLRAIFDDNPISGGKMRLIKTVEDMKTFVAETRGRGKSLGLVPTMGALHEGHLSLVRQAKQQCDLIVVSIFINPAQFAPHEDFDRYPRNLDRDLNFLNAHNVDVVFVPSVKEMYPDRFETYVESGPLSRCFEGSVRPTHFRGVLTVVLKLFNIIQPDVAYFGQKDFQQAVLVRRMLEDFNLNVRMVLCPLVRDADGLALSSRNAYLSPEKREKALALSRSLQRAQKMVFAGEGNAQNVLNEMRRVLLGVPELQIDYAAIVDPATLEPLERVIAGCVGLVAGRVEGVRLIDNLIFGPPGATPDLLLQLAITGAPVSTREARIPGLETETLKLRIESCRECAAISTIQLPPREFLVKYIKQDYPDLNTVKVAVIGRSAPIRSENFLYRNQGKLNRFTTGLFELLGVENFADFKKRFILTDVLRCHSTGPHIHERAMQNCAQHLRSEIELFPNLQTLVILGDDAYFYIQHFLLGRNPASVPPFDDFLGSRGWAEEQIDLSILGERRLRIFYCYHPSFGYKRSPSVAALLRE